MASETRRVTAILREAIGLVTGRLAVNISAELITDTPVDTGWARANWVPSIGVPIDEPETDQADASLVPAATSRQQTGIAAVTATYSLDQGSIFLSNNVPYITLLNMGTSAQAPAGFVQTAIIRGIESLDGQVIG